MTHRLVAVLTIAVLALVAACSVGGPVSPSTATGPPPSAVPSSAAPSASPSASVAAIDLTIYGAASLKGVLDQVRTAYAAAIPGTTLTISTDSSSALETQIEQAAPADVFLSADLANPQKLVDRGLADGAAVAFAGNKLTIVVPTDNPARISTPADLARSGVKVIAAGDAVPITRYADQVVGKLAEEAGYPAGFVAGYTANIVSREDNVKALIGKIELGEGDAGIVYVTDARASGKVASIDVPDRDNVPATYAGVVVRASAHVEAARAFLTWFAGPDGQAILTGSGFLPPS